MSCNQFLILQSEKCDKKKRNRGYWHEFERIQQHSTLNSGKFNFELEQNPDYILGNPLQKLISEIKLKEEIRLEKTTINKNLILNKCESYI